MAEEPIPAIEEVLDEAEIVDELSEFDLLFPIVPASDDPWPPDESLGTQDLVDDIEEQQDPTEVEQTVEGAGGPAQLDEFRQDVAFDWTALEFFQAGNGEPLRITGDDAIVGWANAALNTPKGKFAIFCADMETEILTEKGWLRHGDLRPGMRVLTLDHSRSVSEWQPAQAVHRFRVQNEEMVEINSRRHSSLTTLDHRWPTLRPRREPDGSRRYIPCWRLSSQLNTGDKLITAAPCVDLPSQPTFSDDLVEAVAWFYTEGHIRDKKGRSRQVVLTQSKSANPSNVLRIRNALTSLFGQVTEERMATAGGPLAPPKWREHQHTGRNDALVQFWLNTAASGDLLAIAPEKVVGIDFVRTLTRSQLELFVEVSFAADGWAEKNRLRIGQMDPRRLDALEFALILLGKSVHRYDAPYTYKGNEGKMAMLSVSKATTVGSEAPGGALRKARRRRYAGVVWCPTTPNGTWLARRNGCVYFTGNSPNFGSNLLELLGQVLADAVLFSEAARGVVACLIQHPRITRVSVDSIYRQPQIPDALIIDISMFIDDNPVPLTMQHIT